MSPDKFSNLHSQVIETMYLGPHLDCFECNDNLYKYFSDRNQASSNFVGFKLNENNRNELDIIDQTIFLFSKNKVPFTWLCEDSREDRVSQALKRRNFKQAFSFWGMVHTKTNFVPNAQGGVFSEEVEISELLKLRDLIASQLKVPLGYVDQSLRQDAYSKTQRLRAYAVYISPKKIIGVALLIELSDVSTAVLRLAVVMPEFRRMGAYKELVRIRMADAYKSGMESIITHAYESSSLYLENLGMKKYKRFTAYVSPPYR